jgi:hypothetical protein
MSACRGLIGAPALQREVARQVFVLVPAAVIELDEPDVALGQPTGQQAIRSVSTGLPRVRPVHLESGVRLLRQVHQVGNGRLHPVGHLVLRDPRLDLRVAVRVVTHRVELLDGVQHRAARDLVHPGRIVEVQHRFAAGPEAHALIRRRQETAAPQAREERLVGVDRLRLREEHDEGRQVLVLAAEAVTEPRAHARASRLLEPRLDERNRGIVIDRLGVHRLDDGDVVDDLRRVRQELADPRARLPVLLEREQRLAHRQQRLPHRLRDALALADRVGNLRPWYFASSGL